MPELKWKTDDALSPQGKPRVYFCCHEKDFVRYFEALSDEILEKHNCAVYYDNDPKGEITEEWYSYLKDMQLFVMPVTTALLTTENKALKKEFTFAEEKNIPILPIMCENDLDPIFADKVGELQYLDRCKDDVTAISYKEKLNSFLDAVLVGDELAAKVRAAFDAYIFLSYRKKDRLCAQELMRLIHNNDLCRDIAIWYDEFLVPGENFNKEIEDAINKSELFALAVTPNLVNEQNYVMTVEYPKARELGKAILPAEIISTDKKLLREKYENIPYCTDAHNSIELSEALLKSLERIALRENDSDPEHNFFIGLAYLSGIDVEVDHERALSLITSSAQAGLPEAMRKLSSMYRYGEGVARDYEKAEYWLTKNSDYYRDLWERYSVRNNYECYAGALEILASLQEDVSQRDSVIETLCNLKNLCEKALGMFEDKNLSIKRAYIRAGLRIADKYMQKNEHDKAQSFAESFTAEAERIADRTKLFDDMIFCCNGYNILSSIYQLKGELEKGGYVTLRSVEILENLSENVENIRIKKLLMGVYFLAASYFLIASDKDNAEIMCSKAADVYEKHLSHTVNINYIAALLIRSRSRIVNGDFDGAVSESQKCLGVCSEWYEKDPIIQNEALLGNALLTLAQCYHIKGENEKALTEAAKSEKILGALYRNGYMIYDLQYSECKFLQGSVYSECGNTEKAKELFEESIEIVEKKGLNELNYIGSSELVNRYYSLADICIEEEDYDRAEELCHKALSIAEGSKGEFSKEYVPGIFASLYRIADVQGDTESKRKYAHRIFELCEDNYQKHNTYENALMLATVCIDIFAYSVYESQEDDLLEKGLKLCELCDCFPQLREQFFEQYCISKAFFAEYCSEQGDSAMGEKTLLDLYGCDEKDDKSKAPLLIYPYTVLAQIYFEDGQYERAIVILNEAQTFIPEDQELKENLSFEIEEYVRLYERVQKKLNEKGLSEGVSDEEAQDRTIDEYIEIEKAYDALDREKDYAEVRKLLSEGISVLLRAKDKSLLITAKYNLFVRCIDLAYALWKKEKYHEATELYSETAKLVCSFAPDENHLYNIRHFIYICCRLGDIHKEQGNTEKAKDMYFSASRAAENIIPASSDKETCLAVYIALERAGDIIKAQGEYSILSDIYRSSADILTRLEDVKALETAKYNFILRCNNIVGSIINKERSDIAKSCCIYASRVAQALELNDRTFEVINGISEAFCLVGDSFSGMKNSSEGIDCYRRATELVFRLTEYQQVAQKSHFICLALEKYADALILDRDFNGAMEFCKKVPELLTKLGDNDDVRNAKISFAGKFLDFSHVFSVNDSSDRAEEAALYGINLLEPISDDKSVSKQLILLYSIYYGACVSLGKKQGADKAKIKIIDYACRSVRENPCYESEKKYAAVVYMFAVTENGKEAEEELRTACELYSELQKNYPEEFDCFGELNDIKKRLGIQ